METAVHLYRTTALLKEERKILLCFLSTWIGRLAAKKANLNEALDGQDELENYSSKEHPLQLDMQDGFSSI